MNPTGRIVREWRDGLKLSQSQFAKLADVHPMTVSRWERGADVPLSAVAMYKLRKLHERLTAQAMEQAAITLRNHVIVVGEDGEPMPLVEPASAEPEKPEEVVDDSEPMLPGIVAEETTDA